MFGRKNGTRRSGSTIIATITLLALASAGAGSYIASAEEPWNPGEAASVAPAPADLEQAFWACDYVGTTYGVSAAPIAFCADATAAVIEQKFDGDFEQMLDWWRRNKPAQHARLQAVSVRTVAVR